MLFTTGGEFALFGLVAGPCTSKLNTANTAFNECVLQGNII